MQLANGGRRSASLCRNDDAAGYRLVQRIQLLIECSQRIIDFGTLCRIDSTQSFYRPVKSLRLSVDISSHAGQMGLVLNGDETWCCSDKTACLLRETERLDRGWHAPRHDRTHRGGDIVGGIKSEKGGDDSHARRGTERHIQARANCSESQRRGDAIIPA